MTWETIDSKTKVDNWGDTYQSDTVKCSYCGFVDEFDDPAHYDTPCECESSQKQTDAA